MARYNSIVFGSMNGSIGNATTQKWRGIDSVRQKPTTVANPKTEAQTDHRITFALLVALSRVLNSVFMIGLAKQAIKKTAYNVFTSLNYAAGLVTTAAGVTTWDMSKLIVAYGSSNNITAADQVVTGAELSLDNFTISGTEPPGNSVVYVAVVRKPVSGPPVLIGFASAPFSEDEINVTCDSTIVPSTDNAYLFYVDANTNQPCDTFYVNIA